MLRRWGPLALITLAGLALRLLAWSWSELRPLGGDEQEYLALALSIARQEGYYELQFMRGPLFPAWLAVWAIVTQSDVQLLRLVNALVSTATIPLMYWWTALLLRPERRTAPLLAAALCAAWYTLAMNATELLTETLTLFGLIAGLALLAQAEARASWRWAAAAGATLGLVCLLRSVPLPLLILGALLLGWRARPRLAGAFVLAAALMILPWTVRNALVYDAFILIDTTGQENLWLDNDPAGRDAVKAQLYALGDDQPARAALATERGLAAIRANPAWFAAKATTELRRFWALEHADDMLARPAIWVSPPETWLRLLAGDGLWLVLAVGGALGLVLAPLPWRWRALLALWAAYTIATGALFHVEFRYRLPLLPVLAPCAGWALAQAARRPWRLGWLRSLRGAAALALSGTILVLILSWGAYPSQAARLAHKHWLLWRAEATLAEVTGPSGPLNGSGRGVPLALVQGRASAALQLDPRSALARVLLARVALLEGDLAGAETLLRDAIAAQPAHPYAHLLLGDLLRARGEDADARASLAYERASREDLQAWARARFVVSTPPTELLVGGGLDLGFITGFYGPEAAGGRWMHDTARLELTIPPDATSVALTVAAPRPSGYPAPTLQVGLGFVVHEYVVPAEPTTLFVPVPRGVQGAQVITLAVDTSFVPADADRANPDGRELSVLVLQAAAKAP